MTILEVMIAVLVLSFGILTAGAMYSSSALLRSRSGGYSRAAAIATRKLEQIRRLPAAQITADTLRAQNMADAATTTTTTGGTTQTVGTSGTSTGTASTSGTGTSSSSGSLTFTNTDNVPNDLTLGTGTIQLSGVGTDLVTITVTLNWTGMRGKAESLTTTTYVADKTAWKG